MKLRNVFPIIAMLMIVLIAGCNKKDDLTGVPPKVTSTNPISEATNIGISSKISAIFSVAMNSSTITDANFTVMQGTVAVSGTVGYAGTTATFTPSANMATSTLYTATISTGVKDASGMALATDYIWSFTTAEGPPDLTPPTVTLTDPVNNTTDVDISKPIAVTFSETMDPTTITFLTYTLIQGSTSVPGAVTYTGTKYTFTPTNNLEYSKDYTGTITTGAKDMAGNALASIYTFSFTTVDAPDITLPMASSTNPIASATGVALNTQVAITFSEEMDSSTISTSFTLKQGTIDVLGEVTYSGTTATFTPTDPLEGGKEYTATVTTGATDLVGNPLAADVVWKFTTLVPATGPAFVDLKTAGNFVILAKTGITTTGTTQIIGDIGVSPAAATSITGFDLILPAGGAFSTSALVTGNVYAPGYADPTPANMTTAVSDMETAYTDAAGRTLPDYTELGEGDVTGKTLTPGLYKWGTGLLISAAGVTISGSATDVWIFQIAQDLTVGNGAIITLDGGALAKNIFWQVAGVATLGTTSQFKGIILSMTDIIFQTGSSIDGRALSQTAVALDATAVTEP